MNPKLNIENHIAKHEECGKILDMIRRNREYMLSDMNPRPVQLQIHGTRCFAERVETRKKIQTRLISYYAKKVASIGSQAYEVAMAIKEPKQSA